MPNKTEKEDYFESIKKRKNLLIFSFIIFFLLIIIVALALPPIYKSEAYIRIEGQQIPREFIKSTIPDFVEERIQKISQRVLKTSTLKEIIHEFDLYQDENKNNENISIELLEKFRKKIKIENIDTEIKQERKSITIAFNLSFEDKDPIIAQKVTEKISLLFLEEDIKAREELASATTDFLSEELKNLKANIENYEFEISKFKKENAGKMPSDRPYVLQSISQLERDLNRNETQLFILREKQIILEAQIANVEPLKPIVMDGKDIAANPKERLKNLRIELARRQSLYSEKHPDIKKMKREINELEQRVQDSDDSFQKVKKLQLLEDEYLVTVAKFGPKHPDSLKLQKEIRNLVKEVDNIGTKRTITNVSEENPDNPLYINLQAQVKSIILEISKLEEEKIKLSNKLSDYHKDLHIIPNVEKKYKEILRDYEALTGKYKEVSNELMNARTAQKMEIKKRGKRFNITSPAYLPNKPNKPNRLLILILGFMLSFGFSMVLTIYKDSIDKTIRSSKQVKQISEIPVLASVSYIVTEKEKRIKRIKKLCWIFIIFFIIIGGVYFIDKNIIDIQEVWPIIIERVKMIA